MSLFTIEESNLIGMYPHNSKRELLEELHLAVIHINEPEVEALVHQVIAKVVKVSDDAFNQEEFVLEEE